MLKLETLEAREVPSISFAFDYQSPEFTPAMRRTIERAADELGSRLTPASGSGNELTIRVSVTAGPLEKFVAFAGTEDRGKTGYMIFDLPKFSHTLPTEYGLQPGETDLYSFVLHELGHVLGLPHTGAPGAIMNDTLPPTGQRRHYTEVDFAALRDLGWEISLEPSYTEFGLLSVVNSDRSVTQFLVYGVQFVPLGTIRGPIVIVDDFDLDGTADLQVVSVSPSFEFILGSEGFIQEPTVAIPFPFLYHRFDGRGELRQL